MLRPPCKKQRKNKGKPQRSVRNTKWAIDRREHYNYNTALPHNRDHDRGCYARGGGDGGAGRDQDHDTYPPRSLPPFLIAHFCVLCRALCFTLILTGVTVVSRVSPAPLCLLCLQAAGANSDSDPPPPPRRSPCPPPSLDSTDLS